MGVTLPSKSAQLVWGCNTQRSFGPAPVASGQKGLNSLMGRGGGRKPCVLGSSLDTD